MELHITSAVEPAVVAVNSRHQGALHIHTGNPHYHPHPQMATQMHRTESDWNVVAGTAQMHIASSSSLPSSNSVAGLASPLVNGGAATNGHQMAQAVTGDALPAAKPKRDFRFQLIQMPQAPKWFIMPTPHGNKRRRRKGDDEDEEEEKGNGSAEKQGGEANNTRNKNLSSSSSDASTSTSTNTPSQLSTTSDSSSGGDVLMKNSSDQENRRPAAQQPNNDVKPTAEIAQQGALKPSLMCVSHELYYALVNNASNNSQHQQQPDGAVHCEAGSAFEILAVSDPEEEMADDE